MRKHEKILCVAIGIFAISTYGTAQAPLAGILVRIQAAHGIRWSSGEIRDWQESGKITLFTTEGAQASFDVTVQHKGLNEVQRIIKQSRGELKQGTDGTKNWDSLRAGFKTAAQGRTLQFLDSQTVHSIQRLLNFAAEGLTLRDAVNDGKAHTLETTDRQGRKTQYTFDERTGIVTQVEFVVGQAKDPFSGRITDAKDTYRFSDYRLVQGALTPFRVERWNGGWKTEELQFSGITYNTGLKDQDFAP
jgi:hypothetical protein